MSFSFSRCHLVALVLLSFLFLAGAATASAQSIGGQLEWRVRQRIEEIRQRDLWRQLEQMSEMLREHRLRRAEMQREQQAVSNSANLAESNAAKKQEKKLSLPGTFSPRARAYSLCEK